MANVSILYQKLQARKAAILQDRDALSQSIEEVNTELASVEKLLAGFSYILAEAEYIESHSGVVIE